MDDYSNLKAACKAVIGPHFGDADDRFFELAKPAVILGMIAEIERLRGEAAPSAGERSAKLQSTPEDHTAARYIYGLILNVCPKMPEPNWRTWDDDVRKMREIDGHTHREICALFQWANRDDFWCVNILSPLKLRKQWVQLEAKRDRAAHPVKPQILGKAGKATATAAQEWLRRRNAG